MNIKHPEYFGQLLHKKGFRVWFLYMFKLIEGRKFIQEPLHEELFETYQSIYDNKNQRINITVPPRSGKTTLAKYFIAYSIASNPECNFIYTSYSQSLLSDIARDIIEVLTHPVYQAMYSNSYQQEETELRPVDEFWADYLQVKDGKMSFSSKKIVTQEGGIILFASIGSSLTGFGCGQRDAKRFSGCLIIDDPHKPADIHSQIMRVKVKTYFEETLLSRLNDSNVPICNIQQRLHVDDLCAFLESRYNYNTLKKPLLIDGICQLPTQYTKERIIELQKNEFMFNAQYQQAPILQGGNLFKKESYILGRIPQEFDYCFITADLSYKDKAINDYTVFSYFGVKNEIINDRKRPHLYLIEVKRKRINSVEIENWILPWIQSKIKYSFRNVWIEDKGHGIYLIQLFQKKGLPVANERMIKETLPRDADKVQRANNIIPCLDIINPNLTFNKDIENLDELVEEYLSFPNSNNDDFVDTIIDGVKIGLFENRSRIMAIDF